MVALSLIGIALRALWVNKLRSGLTLLGIIIGVTSVMTIISALEGMMGAIEDDLSRLGPKTFFVQKWGITTSRTEALEMAKRRPVNTNSVSLIEEGCDMCDQVSPGVGARADVKSGRTRLRDVHIGGTTANRIDIVDIEVEQGRFHSAEDDLHRRRVAFIGHRIAEVLFTNLDPLGKSIRIGGRRFTVIGVAKKQGSMFGDERDEFVIIPYSTHVKQFGDPGERFHIVISAVSVAHLQDAIDQVRTVLRSSRHVPYNKPDDFAVLTADNILDFLNQITRLFRLGLVGVSSIAVVVGGIVVMNIMMVSVTERTREIGIRKAVGAKQKHVLLQFMFEALATTLSGGAVGIVLGFLLARSLIGMLDMDISPSTLAVIVGLSISTGIGLIFGIYPAMKAARLDPIKALSYE